MKESEITALAREYAEEIHAGTSEPFKDDVICEEIENAESVIRFLLRRYALVEKEAVRKEYHEIKLALGDGGRSELEDDINMEKEALLESLFPEIAKEVEE